MASFSPSEPAFHSTYADDMNRVVDADAASAWIKDQIETHGRDRDTVVTELLIEVDRKIRRDRNKRAREEQGREVADAKFAQEFAIKLDRITRLKVDEVEDSRRALDTTIASARSLLMEFQDFYEL